MIEEGKEGGRKRRKEEVIYEEWKELERQERKKEEWKNE